MRHQLQGCDFEDEIKKILNRYCGLKWVIVLVELKLLIEFIHLI